MRHALFALSLLIVPGCGSPSTPTSDAGHDAFVPAIDAPLDAFVPVDASAHDVGVDATDTGPACTRPVGERFSAGDTCNFCECGADGTTTCTHRTCHPSIGGCTYSGTMHDYGARFPSSDGCNECVCAASGLACTVRPSCTDVPDSAILLEQPNDSCGTNPEFTPAHVLSTLPTSDFVAPFLYERVRASYPEHLPDTNVRLRIVFDDGFMVCRIPMPTQPALDLQVTVEWITEDGALNEGFPAYLRRNDFGFVDAWWIDASAPLGGLAGTYVPNCAIDPGGYAFSAQIDPDGHATGAMNRVCETDLSLTVGTFERLAP